MSGFQVESADSSQKKGGNTEPGSSKRVDAAFDVMNVVVRATQPYFFVQHIQLFYLIFLLQLLFFLAEKKHI